MIRCAGRRGNQADLVSVWTSKPIDLKLNRMNTRVAIAVLVTASISAIASAQHPEVRLKFAETSKAISFDWLFPLQSYRVTDLSDHTTIRKVPMHSEDMLFGPNFFPFPKHSFFTDPIYLFDRPKAAESNSQGR